MIAKVMRYEIIRPMNIEWKLFEKILGELRYDTWQLLNRTIQMLWDF